MYWLLLFPLAGVLTMLVAALVLALLFSEDLEQKP
jgi:hypothetical protein